MQTSVETEATVKNDQVSLIRINDGVEVSKVMSTTVQGSKKGGFFCKCCNNAVLIGA